MTAPLELWGGHECTVNRIGDRWRDQTVLSGHQDRITDLEAFADLGLKALRYPILWERVETEPGVFDWSWADARMARLRDLGLRPVIGLLHHGSGPRWTDLLDPDFAQGLGEFAGQAADRYPWVTDWTPVNEPLTTARFSALYGHWHPHGRDEGMFWAALLNQIEGTRAAMRAIRRTVPDARLVQTEDFGWTWSTAACADQAAYENDRRLMTWDLLCGRVVDGHPLRGDLDRRGHAQRLDHLAADPCPPGLVGLNHYVTSDRFLDERLDRYPARAHGGNGRIAYADVEAVRVLHRQSCSWERCLGLLWDRYRIPLAVTECHLGSSPEQQRRWLDRAWAAALSARDHGVAVEAVTVWALLGSYDWDTLLTGDNGRYEPGAFDLSAGDGPQPTALAAALQGLARHGAMPGPEPGPGWWDHDARLEYPPCHPAASAAPPRFDPATRFMSLSHLEG
ncbi:MAG: glycoside hydrolase [Pseudomonadota bacterium]|nr:glycoside hydrolase [Pseudomonadota bacterium]